MSVGRKRNGKIDEEIEETFPASDPPAFLPGSLGAPKGRKTTKAVKKKKAAKKARAKKGRTVTKARAKKTKRKAATKRRKAR
jgi:hypothetical protein